jgi:hypothetical protein
MTAPRRRRTARVGVSVVVLALVAALVGVVAITNDTFGAGHLFDRAVAKVDRFLAGPVPDRSAPVTVVVPEASPDAAELDPDEVDPSAEVAASGTPPAASVAPLATPVASASAAAVPTPARVAVDVDIVSNHKKVFAHEQKITWCAPAGVQMVLAMHGKGDTSNEFQRELQARVHDWESRADSHNGDWGPSAMALEWTKAPVILLAWRGAHTWVMTGFRADADPAIFADAKIKGAYINDPWYPDVSSIWGPSDAPGTFQDNDEMIRNYLKWKRPEGLYPARDGLYISVVPTKVRKAS